MKARQEPCFFSAFDRRMRVRRTLPREEEKGSIVTRRRFSCRYIITLPRACANVWRHKFTYFCRKKNDVLRHDVVSFEVEPLTNAHSFGDVFEPDENYGRVCLNITSAPSPFVSESYANSCNTRSEYTACSKTLSQTFRPRVILISPSFPSGFPPPCPIRVQSSHHAGLAAHSYKRF